MYYLLRVFHIRFSWWSFTEVWVTASLLKSPGLFSVFWSFSIMLLFGWSPLVIIITIMIDIVVVVFCHILIRLTVQVKWHQVFSTVQLIFNLYFCFKWYIHPCNFYCTLLSTAERVRVTYLNLSVILFIFFFHYFYSLFIILYSLFFIFFFHYLS